MEQFESIIPKIMELVTQYGLKFLMAIVALIIGLWIIKLIVKGFKKILIQQKFDATLTPFLVSIAEIVLKILLVISVVGLMGIPMTSFIAIMGAAGLAVGMALSGTLQNFAGGVMILIFKPFLVGDLIESQGYTGVVKEIQIFVTILLTVDNKTVIIPNGPLSNGSMINYSTQEKRRVDLVFGISYTDDIDKAKAIITQVLENEPKALKDPEFFVGVVELADNSVNIVARPWVLSADYWPVYFRLQENMKKAFDKEGISIPFPQRDIHIYKTE